MKNRIADNWDRVLSSSPLNGTAAAVTGKGEHYDFELPKGFPHWKFPPPTIPATKFHRVDLIGTSKGRLTIIGVYATGSYSGTSWLVRCACGDYEVRSSKALLNPKNDDDKCHVCRRLDILKKRERFMRTKEGQAWAVANLDPLVKAKAEPSP